MRLACSAALSISSKSLADEADFMLLGLTERGACRVVRVLSLDHGVHLSAHAVMENASVAQLAAYIDEGATGFKMTPANAHSGATKAEIRRQLVTPLITGL